MLGIEREEKLSFKDHCILSLASLICIAEDIIECVSFATLVVDWSSWLYQYTKYVFKIEED